MLGFVQNFFAPRCNPIGVDFGSETLRLAQVQWTGSEHKLIAAASADVPTHLRNDVAGRMTFFADAARDLLAQGEFKGRHAVLALPAASMYIQHLRMPKLDDEALRKALPWEARGKLPIDPSQAVLRHLIAGDIYQDQEPKSEVIVMAAGRELVNQFLAAANRAKLDVVGMNVEPQALLDCFNHVHRRRLDAGTTSCFIDVGATSTRAIITRDGKILFARVIAVGGEHFNRAVADAMKISASDAKVLRIRISNAQPALDERRKKQAVEVPMPPPPAAPEPDSESNSFALLGAAMAASSKRAQAAPPAPAPAVALAEAPVAADHPDRELLEQATQVEQACSEPIGTLVQELDLCRRYYEATFPDKPVDRLVFVGGEARQRYLCQQIARQLGLAAQLGDPLVRMGRISEVGIESGIDLRQPQPTWAVAVGLSMGPAPEDMA